MRGRYTRLLDHDFDFSTPVTYLFRLSPKANMPDFSKLFAAIAERDAVEVRTQILAHEFVLLGISEDEEGDDGDFGALTAQVGEFDVLVAFTSEANAGVFVDEMAELFEDEEEVEGIAVEGGALLEYLPGGFGLLLNPESEDSSVIDPALAGEINQ